MAQVVPTITAENPHVFREQVERVQGFAKRIHIDLMDGVFTENKSVDLSQIWWPDGIVADIHAMFDNPQQHIEAFIRLQPHMVIVQAESHCDIPNFAKSLAQNGIKTGIALLSTTPVEAVADALTAAQQILIFSGNLGHQGGSHADFSLLEKAGQIRAMHPQVEEIAWDGGVNEENAKRLVTEGVSVLNVGGFIHFADNPAAAFKRLQALVA